MRFKKLGVVARGGIEPPTRGFSVRWPIAGEGTGHPGLEIRNGGGTAQAWRMDKLQRAGRDFLMRLVAKHGLAGEARVLRVLADELEALGPA